MDDRIDINNWRDLENARAALIGELDQIAAKIADISADHRCVRELTDRGVCDTLLCEIRRGITDASKEAGWKLRCIHHRLARLSWIEERLRREDEEARLAALASLDAAANPQAAGRNPHPILKGGLA